MSLLNDTKQELLENKISGPCCKRAFLAGVIRGAGSLSLEPEGFGLILQHPVPELIEKCALLVKKLTGVQPEISKKEKDRILGNKIVYEMKLDAATTRVVLTSAGIVDSPYSVLHQLPEEIVGKPCCLRSFLQGLFLAAGSLSLPESGGDGSVKTSKGYHLEFTLTDRDIAEQVKDLLIGLNINAKLRERKTTYAVYVKNGNEISDFFAEMKAMKAYFAIVNTIIGRLARNSANRQANCIVANADRAVETATKHIAAIRKIDRAIGLNNLDETLRETARYRLEHPDLSVAELLRIMPNPPSKSGLNHRLRKLLEIAEQFKETVPSKH